MKKKIIEVKQVEWFDDHFYKVRYLNEAKQEITDYFPSTTTKLGALAKPHLIQWFGDLGTREALLRRDEAGDKGTRLHWCWYTYMSGGAVVYNNPRSPLYSPTELEEIHARFPSIATLRSQEEMFNMMKLQKFVQMVKPKVVANETILCDMDNKEAGTVDNIFYIEEGKYLVNGAAALELPKGLYIFDLKSGKTVGDDALMQVADYAVMAEKSGYGEITGALIGHTQAKTKKGIEGFSLTYLDKKQMKEKYQDFRDIAKVWERNCGGRKPVVRDIAGLIALDTKGGK